MDEFPAPAPAPAPARTVVALDASTWPLFADLVERHGGIFGGCWCMGFHPEGVGRGTTAETNRERKLARVREGTAMAALVLDDGVAVGWCQFGRPVDLPRIKNRAAYAANAGDPPEWRIACCYVGTGHRRQGVAHAALGGALDLIADHGGGTVEGYPEDARLVPAGFLYHGALQTYERHGFVRDRMIGKHRWVVSREVAPDVHGPTVGRHPLPPKGFGAQDGAGSGPRPVQQVLPSSTSHDPSATRATSRVRRPFT